LPETSLRVKRGRAATLKISYKFKVKKGGFLTLFYS